MIDAFRVIDHVIVMTRGGPDNATTLLLFYVYETGFRFWDTAAAATATVVLLTIMALAAAFQFGVLGLLWMLPLLYAAWTAIHPVAYATHFDPAAPLTLRNFATAMTSAPQLVAFLLFQRQFVQSFMRAGIR